MDESAEECQPEYSDEDTEYCNVSSFGREKGTKYPVVSSFRSSDKMYDQLLSYKYYRLRNLAQGDNAPGMVKLPVFIQGIDITMKEYNFNWTDPMTVFQFTIHFVNEAHRLNMLEGHAYTALPTYPTGKA